MSASAITSSLVSWFRQNGRDYPWRQTRDPYAILVSEVMLQQTQITTVLDRGYYHRWLARFPDIPTLASANEADVLSAWEGLGYYRRARNLQKLAQIILQDHTGIFPNDPVTIRSLPGIGPYTAGAVSSFAFGLNEPIVDGNVARVLSRIDNDPTPIDSTLGNKRLWDRAKELVTSTDDPRAFIPMAGRILSPRVFLPSVVVLATALLFVSNSMTSRNTAEWEDRTLPLPVYARAFTARAATLLTVEVRRNPIVRHRDRLLLR